MLSGGGARAAYQVGVLHGMRDAGLLDEQPFDLICGTSAGAINATFLAGNAHRFPQGIDALFEAWSGLSAIDIYDASWHGVARSILRFLWAFLRGSGGGEQPLALVDNVRLESLLSEWLDFGAVRQNLHDGRLENLCITAMDYNNGESVTFFDGLPAPGWRRRQRCGRTARLGLEHVLASTAIPMLFPPQRIGDTWYGDGALRQLHPLSAAIHLGAKRLLIIGVSGNASGELGNEPGAPSPAQIAGHMLAREFIDNLEADVELAEKLNVVARYVDPALRADLDTRAVGIHVVTPSLAFDEAAGRYLGRQPTSIRLLLRLLGASEEHGRSFASYLLFDGGFCQELMACGRRDALEDADSIAEFLS